VFIKLSSRSPKDAVIKTKKFHDLLKKELKQQKNKNEALAVIKTLNQCLKVSKGSEAVGK
jgi:hypothetical protein